MANQYTEIIKGKNKICEYCGKEFLVYDYYKKERKCCSLDCSNKLRCEQMKYNFAIQNCKLLTENYINIFQRFDFTCNIHRDKKVQVIKYSDYYAYQRDGWNFCDYCRHGDNYDIKHDKRYMNKWNVENMQEYCDDNVEGYKVLDTKRVDLQNSKKKASTLYTLFKCPEESHKPFWAQWNGFKNHGKRCTHCSHMNLLKSNGEKEIENALIKSNVKFVLQKGFDNLRGIRGWPLFYDFYLADNNLLIEFQGAQHERYIEFFHRTYYGFLKQQEYDRRKKEFAKQNNISFLEIWYYDFNNIANIISESLGIVV